jgi:hypothetical protein
MLIRHGRNPKQRTLLPLRGKTQHPSLQLLIEECWPAKHKSEGVTMGAGNAAGGESRLHDPN